MIIYRFIIAILFTYLFSDAFAQSQFTRFPEKELEIFNRIALERIKNNDTALMRTVKTDRFLSGASQLFALKKKLSNYKIKTPEKEKISTLSDTLFVVDTMEITGNWIYNGAIVIAGTGMMHFKNSNATILGDVFLLGENPQLIADSSTLFIPQAYFYQRVVFATGGARIIYRNSTIDHSGLSHNIILVDSARLELKDVINKGFTTNGIYGKSTVDVNSINEAGEYVIVDETDLQFKNARTILLWHQFPENAIVNFTFPDSDTTYGYHFNNTVPGVSGINYRIKVDSSYNVMWGMMPTGNSDITISDSEIRAIGLWFMDSDTINVSGLVNNSYYAHFEAPLSDRSLNLINSTVKTWSIYPMQQSYINLSDCIVGEAGTMGHSTLMGQQYLCDGSGGYVWASDSSLTINGFSFVSGHVRSQANGMLLFAYSALVNGYPSALQNSMMMVIQSTLPAEPVALDNSVVWYAYIDKPFSADAGAIVPITGSAWIDKTSSSNWMDFRSYRLYYQIPESNDWIEIEVDSLNEKRNEILGYWNTSGLPAGQYLIRLIVSDNWGNSAIALKGINLLPVFGLHDTEYLDFTLFPNPAENQIFLQTNANCAKAVITIADVTGKIQIKNDISNELLQNSPVLPIEGMLPGIYFVKIECGAKIFNKKLIVR